MSGEGGEGGEGASLRGSITFYRLDGAATFEICLLRRGSLPTLLPGLSSCRLSSKSPYLSTQLATFRRDERCASRQ